eukprot:432897_1
MQTKFIVSNLRMWQYLQDIPWDRNDSLLPFKVEAVLQTQEWLYRVQCIDLNEDIVIINDVNQSIAHGGYMSTTHCQITYEDLMCAIQIHGIRYGETYPSHIGQQR